ncbi:DgyrCDS3274 [Dimorphilus gyrociliatus]|uniref:DgyrCDS3274 n=1 Tax=Dimorphilus gyrociliatus TaxID=2664684 RepID=A0A7I8VDU5_9ANNE|nr:DgyrCDS3274 [Dimorphilus gyrociliatus]
MGLIKQNVRFEALKEKLIESDSDVICLQEIWNDEEIFELAGYLEEKYPYSFSFIHESNGSIPQHILKGKSKCDARVLADILKCMSLSCAKAMNRNSLFSCTLQKCQVLNKIEKKCLECFIFKALTCVDTNRPDKDPFGFGQCVMEAAGQGRLTYISIFTYKKQILRQATEPGRENHGLLLLSKRKFLKNSLKALPFDRRMIVQRGFLEVQLVGYKYISLLSVIFLLKSVATGYKSWRELKEKAEVDFLINRYSSDSNTFLLGDFNIGPEIKEKQIDGYFDNLYQKMKENGLRNVAVDHLALCTYCKDNTIVQIMDPGYSKNCILDGIIPINIRNRIVKVEREYVRDVRNPIILSIPMSDHYGISAIFEENQN